jgi:Ca-activated chloride channel family protein
MVGHQVKVQIEDQVAVTRVVQTFRNHSDRALEATYVFPVPAGASVKKFTMWVNGKEVAGELVEANKARTIYTDIVRRTQDPGLLEYMGNNLMKLRVFPVPAHGDQKVSLSFTSIAQNDAGLVEYVYPLKADAKNALETFAVEAVIRSQHPIQSVYSPSHAISVTRPSDRKAVVGFEGRQDGKNFQLYYTTGAKDVGLTALFHKEDRKGDGQFMLLISPRAELAKKQQVPRDVVFVLDTSGSMQGARIKQAKNALKYCLRNLGRNDRFGLIHFATSVTRYAEGLQTANKAHLDQAQRWVDGLEAVGSTNIDEALATALAMRPGEAGRNFTIVFFTDGQPTIGETNPDQIVKNVLAKNTAGTRIFTFGVGDDVNAGLLDRLADKTRSVSTYVRETEDIEAKVSSLYGKISKPVLTDLTLEMGPNVILTSYPATPSEPKVKLTEMYPPRLPDLFHGSQLVVIGQYHGKGPARLTLTGRVGKETREFVYNVSFPAKTGKDKAFVEDLWARRKVGYLLDQIRLNGQNKELVDEVVRLAKKHGIATPYTSYLVVPDAGTPVASNGTVGNSIVAPTVPGQMPGPASAPAVRGFVDVEGSITGTPPGTFTAAGSGGPAYQNHGYQIATPPAAAAESPSASFEIFAEGIPSAPKSVTGAAPRTQFAPVLVSPSMNWAAPDACASECTSAPLPVAGKQGVDLSVLLQSMRDQSQVGQRTTRQVAGRTCIQVGGAWIDNGFKAKMPMVKVKAQSDAYFRLLERRPELREVFQLGNYLVWITPSGKALVVDMASGQETMTDREIDRLFASK